MMDQKNSIEIGTIFLEEGKIIIEIDKEAILEEFAGTPATGVTASGTGPIATYGAQPSKNKKIMQKNKYAEPTLQGDVKLSKAQ